MNVTARFIENFKKGRWWDAERVEIRKGEGGKKFAFFYLTPAAANGTERRIRVIHILKNGKPILKKRIGMTRICTGDHFVIEMPVRE